MHAPDQPHVGSATDPVWSTWCTIEGTLDGGLPPDGGKATVAHRTLPTFRAVIRMRKTCDKIVLFSLAVFSLLMVAVVLGITGKIISPATSGE